MFGLLKILQINPEVGVILILTLVFSLCFHEFAHAYIAYRLGDNTAAHQGRLTLNPLAHLDPMGSIMLLVAGFGYAKPVPVNPMNLHNPRTDMMKVAFAGPASNFILAFIGILLMFYFSSDLSVYLGGYNLGYSKNFSQLGLGLWLFTTINITLGIFNLIPLYPLDGGQIFGGFLDKINPRLSYSLRINGPKILLGIILISVFTPFSILGIIIEPFHDLVAVIIGVY